MCKITNKVKEIVLSIPATEGYIDLFEMSSILLDYDEDAEVYLPDGDMRVYKKDSVANCQSLDEIASLTYVDTTHDCDDFAAKLFGKFAGLVWTTDHALNWFVDNNNKLWFVEPQNKKISTDAGNPIRFFLGR
jgi:hypothetical protein